MAPVSLPAGEHVCGTLYLRSGVHLHREHGATILGSTDLADYPLHTDPPVRSFADWRGMRSLIYAESAENIALTGHGTIDGRGEHFESDGTDKEAAPEARKPETVPEKADDYPEATMFGHGPAAGLFIRHARNVRIENVQVESHPDDPRPALVTDDCEDPTP
jgi:polygalacturonase